MSAGSGSSSTTIFIGGLSDGVGEGELAAAFAPFGDVVSVHIPRERRGFGFVEFATPQSALDALDNMHRNVLDGRVLSVSLARRAPAQHKRGPVWADEEWIKTHATPDS